MAETLNLMKTSYAFREVVEAGLVYVKKNLPKILF